MKKSCISIFLATLVFGSAVHAGGADGLVARGRYLVAVGGCNDCHTPGFAEQGERIPEKSRLTGMAVGYSGPWGSAIPPTCGWPRPKRASARGWHGHVAAVCRRCPGRRCRR